MFVLFQIIDLKCFDAWPQFHDVLDCSGTLQGSEIAFCSFTLLFTFLNVNNCYQ